MQLEDMWKTYIFVDLRSDYIEPDCWYHNPKQTESSNIYWKPEDVPKEEVILRKSDFVKTEEGVEVEIIINEYGEYI